MKKRLLAAWRFFAAGTRDHQLAHLGAIATLAVER
jgi:hypothetical protein